MTYGPYVFTKTNRRASAHYRPHESGWVDSWAITRSDGSKVPVTAWGKNLRSMTEVRMFLWERIQAGELKAP